MWLLLNEEKKIESPSLNSITVTYFSTKKSYKKYETLRQILTVAKITPKARKIQTGGGKTVWNKQYK